MSHCMTISTRQDRWPNAGILFCDVNGKLVDNVSNDWNINGEVAPYRFLTPREQLQLMGFKSNAYDVLKNIGIVTGAVSSQSVTEEFEGTLGTVGHRANSAMA